MPACKPGVLVPLSAFLVPLSAFVVPLSAFVKPFFVILAIYSF